jgi:hypothetical protein
MSFRVINGRQIEIIDEPDFTAVTLDPKPVSFKQKVSCTKNNNVLFADNSGNIHIQREPIKKRPIIKRNSVTTDISSVLGKRKLSDSFGPGIHDEERYGQEIIPDFFKTNIGHGVYLYPKGSPARQALQIQQPSSVNITPTRPNTPIYNEDEIINWCYKYIASKKI